MVTETVVELIEQRIEKLRLTLTWIHKKKALGKLTEEGIARLEWERIQTLEQVEFLLYIKKVLRDHVG